MPSVFGPMELGEVIDELQRLNPKDTVRYNFCDRVPTELASYRGFYNHLALTHKPFQPVTVHALLEMAIDALGATFSGYKGGTYRMGKKTPVWVSNWGEVTGLGLVEIVRGEQFVGLLTEVFEI